MSVTADLEHMSREQLLKVGLEQGLSVELMQRMTNYAIVTQLRQKHEEPPAKTQSRRSLKSQVKELRQTLARQDEDDAFDDSATVVDMDYVTKTANPADQRYQRFQFLVSTKKKLRQAISNNSRLLEINMDHLDEDDVAVMQSVIAEHQEQLRLANAELREIHEWFDSVQKQKQVFYNQFLQESIDMTGKLKSHFTRKLTHIKNYIDHMKADTQTEVLKTPAQ